MKPKLYWRKVGSIPEGYDYELFYADDNKKESLASIREFLMGYKVTWPLMELGGQFTSVYETVGNLGEAMKIGKKKAIIFLKKYRGVSI